MLTFYCPNCWDIIPEGSQVCPDCGYRLDDFSDQEYEAKLLMALKHPVQDNRIMAINILGERGSQRAIPAFLQMFQTEDLDYYVIQAMLAAADKIGGPGSRELFELAARHPSALVQRLADHYLTGPIKA